MKPKKRNAGNQMSIYPDTTVANAIQNIATDRGDPRTKVVETACKAFAVLYQRDKWEALKLADQFTTRS